MASIDQYKHRLLGFINCPSDYEIVYLNPTRDIAVYELLDDIPEDEDDFDGKKGDIIVGGGSGEVPAFRVSIPDALNLLVNKQDVYFDNYDQLFKAFWTPTESYKLCNGFKKLGWDTNRPIEFWLAENVCISLTNEVDSFKRLTAKRGLVSRLSWTEDRA
jgi:hypothetical protein